MSREMVKIVFEAGNFRVREFHRYACTPCRDGWRVGTLALPATGGQPCMHGKGMWQAGFIGPRGGWHGIGPFYKSEEAARLVCSALFYASRVPADGID